MNIVKCIVNSSYYVPTLIVQLSPVAIIPIYGGDDYSYNKDYRYEWPLSIEVHRKSIEMHLGNLFGV